MLRVITAEDIEKVCLFTAQVFCSHEPMCKALRAEVPDFVQQFRPLLAACCTSGLSFLLEDKQTRAIDKNNIISISLALPFAQYNTLQWPDTPAFGPMSAIFEDLTHPLESHPGAVLSFVWATHSSHMNKGYTKRVVESTVQAAVQAGCSCLVTDATNVVSQHLLQHFGFQPLIKVRYHDYEHFRSISCTEYVIRAVKQLPVPQQQQQDNLFHRPLPQTMSSSVASTRSDSTSSSCGGAQSTAAAAHVAVQQ